MLCRDPFIRGSQAFPCGRCEPCLRVRRKTWAHRIMLEAKLRSDNAFVTLTYAEEHLPVGNSLHAKDLQNWLKRLRKSIAPLRIRFFAVGEYGDQGNRPHYHLALFGLPLCRRGRTKRTIHNRPDPERCCPICNQIYSTWGFGLVDVAPLEDGSANYIAGYVTKKMTQRHDPRLNGRDPEFARMSLRPGIGHDMMYEVASTMLQFSLESTEADVPVSLRIARRQLPLGRYLRNKLRQMVGKEEGAPEQVLRLKAAELHALHYSLVNDPAYVSIKDALIAKGTTGALSMGAKAKIHKQKRTL